MVWWGVLLIALAALVVGGILGFLITKKLVQKELEKNPPITSSQIRAMYMQMGRKPSESDIKRVMNSMKKAKK